MLLQIASVSAPCFSPPSPRSSSFFLSPSCILVRTLAAFPLFLSLIASFFPLLLFPSSLSQCCYRSHPEQSAPRLVSYTPFLSFFLLHLLSSFLGREAIVVGCAASSVASRTLHSLLLGAPYPIYTPPPGTPYFFFARCLFPI
jgi:hypothetical protein